MVASSVNQVGWGSMTQPLHQALKKMSYNKREGIKKYSLLAHRKLSKEDWHEFEASLGAVE